MLKALILTFLACACFGASAFQITGTVFHDLNSNGVNDAGEPAMAGVTVFLDLNENGVLDAGEPSTITDASGNYSFTTGLSASEYRVAIVAPTGWAIVNATHPLKKLGSYSTHAYQYGDIWGEGHVGVIGGYDSSAPITLVDITDLSNPTATAPWSDPPPPGFTLPATHNCNGICTPDCAGGCGCGCSPQAWYAGASAGSGYQYEYVILRNGLGYFGSNAGLGTSIVDCSNPALPTTIIRFGDAEGASDFVHTLFLDGKYLYIADNRTTRVSVFDVSNSATPRKVRDINAHAGSAGIRVHQINVKNGRLFVAVNPLKNEDTPGVSESEVWDVSNIEVAATWLGSWKSGYCTHTVNVTDDGKYGISSREPYPWEGAVGEVTIWDISDPQNAFKVSTLNGIALGFGDCTAHIPVIKGNLMYVSWYWAGLKVFDITDPTHPALVGHFHTSNSSTEFTGNWGVYPIPGTNTILASDMENGLVTLTPSLPGGHYADLNITPTVALDFAVRPPPSITSKIAAPSPGTLGNPVTFSAAATSEDPIPLTYAWDFGDGSLGAGSSASYAYQATGSYTVTLTVTDSKGAKATSTFSVTIVNPTPTVTTLAPATLDAGSPAFTLTVNGTGFLSSSQIQWNGVPRVTTFVSSSQLTAAISAADLLTAGTAAVTVLTPTPGGGTSNAATFTITTPGSGGGTNGGGGGTGGTGGTGPTALPMTVSKISGAMKYSSGNADSCTLSGIIKSLPTPFDPSGKAVTLDVSGATAQFTLGSRGSGTGASGTFALTLKPYKLSGKTVKGKFSGGDVAFKASLKKGTWSALWAQAGVDPTSSQSNALLTFTVNVTLDGVLYSGTATAHLTSKAKSAGRFK